MFRRRQVHLLIVLLVALGLPALSFTSAAQDPAPTPQTQITPTPQSTPAEPQATPTQMPSPPASTEPTPTPEARPRTVAAQPQTASDMSTHVLWHEADISSLDLFAGPGGDASKPDLSNVTFLKEETGGYSKKFRVRDGAGNEWVVKIGKEGQPETVATRLVWAMGYYTDTTYLAPSVNIQGKGTFENVRFEARPKDVKRLDEWKWQENPFVGTRELQGLKVLMLLLNNWDLKDSNNKILRVHNEEKDMDELRYIVSDLGATLGKTGGIISRSRNKPKDFEKAKFINRVKNNIVEFNYHGKSGSLVSDITVEQARWIGSLLAQLSDQQLQDAIRAANYGPEEAQLVFTTLRARIDELKNLPS